MALVSPGIQISINDQSQYVNNNIGSVPLVLLATAQDKTYNGAAANGTSKANAGQLLAFTSQRDLVTQMGTPSFPLSASGTPVNGSEINEYGLMAAYSALGLTNQLFAIRADIDLNQLVGTSVRPIGAPANGTYWLDTVNTDFGLFETDATNSVFNAVTPIVITDNSKVTGSPSAPKVSVGNVGDYAVVTVNSDGTIANPVRLYYKAGTDSAGSSSSATSVLNNTWTLVGSTTWQNAVPTVTGTIANPTNLVSSGSIVINGQSITVTGTTVSQLVLNINAATVAGVSASVSSRGYLQLFVNDLALNKTLTITDDANHTFARCGITLSSGSASFYTPYFFYGSYAQSPTTGWFSTDSRPRPSGSVWWKTTATGAGFSPVLKKYSTGTGAFKTLSVSAFAGIATAIYGLDPVGGGINIPAGSVYADYYSYDGSANSLKLFASNASGVATATGATPGTITGVITLNASTPGTGSFTQYTLPATGSFSSASVTDVVTEILSQSIPYVTASVTASGALQISHTSGGVITLSNNSGTPLGTGSGSPGIGFYANGGSGYTIINNTVYITNFSDVTSTIEYQASQPYSAPATGTYWYYSNPTDIDIMINDGYGWKGYRTVANDSRGYNLQNTDPNGVIISTTAPQSQSTGANLSVGDIWLDSSDLANFPSLYRCTTGGATPVWSAIDKTDHVSSNGIIFGDARWDTSGTTDVISGSLPAITSLLTSNYIDLDAPDYRLAPRGALLFNTRRSGYNVKKFVPNYFNAAAYPNLPTPPVPGAPTSLPSVKDAWVSASGVDSNNVMHAGSHAQRALIVDAMQSAIDSNLDVLSQVYRFNLICAPGYPELIPNMLTLNDNRGDTAFVIGDTPLDLAPNVTDITAWVNNTGGDGLPSDASSSPYLALYYPAGQTNDLSGNRVVVPASHAALRTFLYSDNVSHPWFAPAGVNRGLVTNLSDIGYINDASGQFVHNSINQGMRDALFTLKINPITQLPGSGLVIWGQLTRSADTTARDRINVVRLENYLRTIFNSIANGYLFEPNDGVTRKSISTQIENALSNILALRGLYDFLVICDTSNNTPDTISNNQLYVDVAIEPMRDVEFIYIPIAIYNPGSIAQLNTTST